LSFPRDGSFVALNDSQNQGEKNRVNEHTALEILFASDLELARASPWTRRSTQATHMCSSSKKVQHDHDRWIRKNWCVDVPKVGRCIRMIWQGWISA
jgi:hypothetical protein